MGGFRGEPRGFLKGIVLCSAFSGKFYGCTGVFDWKVSLESSNMAV